LTEATEGEDNASLFFDLTEEFRDSMFHRR